MTYQNLTLNKGKLVGVDFMSKLSANDDYNYHILDQQPAGVIFFKEGGNDYNSNYSPTASSPNYHVCTDNSSSHNGSGAASTNALIVTSGTVSLQPQRRFYIEGIFNLFTSSAALQVFNIQIFVDNKCITNCIYHIAEQEGAGNADGTHARVWGIFETKDSAVVKKSTIDLRITSINTPLVSGVTKSNILKLRADDIYKFWLKVEDWGAINKLETIV